MRTTQRSGRRKGSLNGTAATCSSATRACKTDLQTTCNFEYSGWLNEANHLGNVAYRVGKKIDWDAVNLRCPNAPYIRREYRKGWTLA